MPTSETFPAPFFTPDDVIFAYTRADALADGELVDLSALAREFGFVLPVAISRTLHADLAAIPASRHLESYEGRAADLLGVLALRIRATKGRHARADRIPFTILLTRPCMEPIPEDLDDWPLYEVVALCGPDDDGEPVITICLPGEE